MKKVKYLLVTILLMIIGTGVVNATASVTVPASIDVTVGETKEIDITVTDLAILMDVASSDSNIVRVENPQVDVTTNGPGSKDEKIKITALAEGTVTLTITNEDGTEFSSENDYKLPETKITVNVKAATAPTPKNPKTGVESYLFAILGVLVIGLLGYAVVSKKGSFNRI